MNATLAAAAIADITNPDYETVAGYCCKFVREVVERAYPGLYNALFAGTAEQTALNFIAAGLGVRVDSFDTVQPGDIVFKITDAGPFGHIGIAVSGNRVAENSSTHEGRVQGAKGYRPFGDWGQIQAVGRIPDASAVVAAYKLMIDSLTVAAMPVKDGAALCPIRTLCGFLGLELDIAADGRALIGGQVFPDAMTILADGHGYAPIRDLAPFVGLQLAVDNTAKTVTLSR